MLAKLSASIARVLNDAGINAGTAYPREAINCPEGCFVRVRLHCVSESGGGFAGYLGVETDEYGNSSELYGVRCDMELGLDIYASHRRENAAEDCEALVDDIVFALGGSEGIALRSICCDGVRHDSDTGLLHCPCRAALSVLLTAVADEDAQQFSDFILKGEIKK